MARTKICVLLRKNKISFNMLFLKGNGGRTQTLPETSWGFWWITLSQPELSLQCANLVKGKNLIACFPEPPACLCGERCWVEHLQYSHTGCSGFTVLSQHCCRVRFEGSSSLHKHEMVLREQLHGPAPKGSPIQQCGIFTSSLSPVMAGRRCPHTSPGPGGDIPRAAMDQPS